MLSLWEDRWRCVTREDAARGVPTHCPEPECGHELDVAMGSKSYKVRCPICGFGNGGPLR